MMNLFTFAKKAGTAMTKYNSKLPSYTRITKLTESAVIGCMYIEANGVVGYHEAPVPQLFLLVQGEG
ncbi:hypothetical protein [Anoxybacillus sp. UARK-01]|uniref:hypothetical protein n=2 Tax=Anoxybacillaceae TaxID=3120669 RepID=UPI001F41F74C|nr:hypothetical protein [Anoxybacillus sp. UARK-01]